MRFWPFTHATPVVTSPALAPPDFTSSARRTKHFTNVLGVFQGGGVRGAALAGAYAEAYARGVRFSAVAGTSAGSIVAALIAAGAKPEYLYGKLTQVAFDSLLRPPEKQARILAPSLKVHVMSSLARLEVDPDVARILTYLGMYSAAGIESWVNEMLRELTGRSENDPDVTFEDLVLPLFVVAANLRSRRAVVWSRAKEPTMSVARAVRRSASIPFFFQPDHDHEGLYVDGGSLSNLPAFVYQLPEARRDIQSSITRVLAFRLIGSAAPRLPQTLAGFLEALGDTHVEGNVDLQLQLQADVHSIPIPTGEVRATDFKTVTEAQRRALWEAGRNATKGFLDDEAAHVRDLRRRKYRGTEEQMYLFTLLATESFSEVTLVGVSSTFVFNVVPTLLYAAQDGLDVRALSRPLGSMAETEETSLVARQRRYDEHSRALLRGTGAQVVDIADGELPWEGFIFRAGNRSRRAVIALPFEGGDPAAEFREREVILYSDPEDRIVIDALERDIARLKPRDGEPAATKTLSWERCPDDEWEKLLRNVSQYRPPDVRMAIEEIALDGLRVVDTYVKEYRIPAARRMIDGFRAEERALFDPYVVHFLDGRKSLVTPPVFELNDAGVATVIEGVTRCYLLADEGATTVRGIVIRGVGAPLPGRTRPLVHLRPASRTIELSENMPDLNRAHFRTIEQDVHPYPETLLT